MEVDEAEVWPRKDFETVRAVVAVWRRCAGTALPTRHDIDPLQFGSGLLPHLMLIEVRAAATDYWWRLCGERASFLFGERLVRRALSDLERSSIEVSSLRGVLDGAVGKRAPVYFEVDDVASSGRPMRGTGAMLPLLAAAGEGAEPPVEHVLGALRLVQLSG